MRVARFALLVKQNITFKSPSPSALSRRNDLEQQLCVGEAGHTSTRCHEAGIDPSDENLLPESSNGRPVSRVLHIVDEQPEAGGCRRQPRNVLRFGRRRVKEAPLSRVRERDDGQLGGVIGDSEPKGRGRGLAGQGGAVQDGLLPAGEALQSVISRKLSLLLVWSDQVSTRVLVDVLKTREGRALVDSPSVTFLCHVWPPSVVDAMLMLLLLSAFVQATKSFPLPKARAGPDICAHL